MGQINFYAAQVNALLNKANSAVQPETTGDLANLATQNKDNLVAALNEVYAGAGGEYVERAEAAAEAAEEVLESIPEDYSDLSDEVGELKSALEQYNVFNEFSFLSGKHTGATTTTGVTITPISPNTFSLATGENTASATTIALYFLDQTSLPPFLPVETEKYIYWENSNSGVSLRINVYCDNNTGGVLAIVEPNIITKIKIPST